MVPSSHPQKAVVYKWDDTSDLALLRLDADEGETGRALALSKATVEGPRPGQAVAAVGNAGLGLMWSMKPGFIAAIGTLSSSLPDILSRLDSRARQAGMGALPSFQEIGESVSADFEKIIGTDTLLIQATAATSPGDSGGPLVDSEGRVVGITSWGRFEPKIAAATNFYIHEDEIREFLSSVPETPLLEIARDLWPPHALAFGMKSLRGNESTFILAGVDEKERLVTIAVDLDGDAGIEPFRRSARIEAPIMALHRRASDNRAVTVYRDGTVVATRGLNGEVVWTINAGNEVLSSSMTTTGEALALGYNDGSIGLFEVESGERIWLGTRHQGAVLDIEFSPSSKLLWSVGVDGFIRRTLLGGGAHPESDFAIGSPASSLSPSPDGKSIAVALFQGPLRVYGTDDFEIQWANELAAYDLSFHPDGRSLLASPLASANYLTRFASQSGEIMQRIETPGSPYGFELSEDGTQACVVLHDSSRFALVDLESGRSTVEWNVSPSPSVGPVRDFVLVRNGLVWVGSGKGALFELDSTRPDQTVEVFNEAVRLDLDELVSQQAFDAEVGLVFDQRLGDVYSLYDLDDDSVFEIVRIDRDADKKADLEYRRVGKTFARHSVERPSGLLLTPERLPETWRERYRAFYSVFQ